MGALQLVLLAVCSVGTVSAGCEEWCAHACDELNGNIEQECGDCDASDPKYTCHAESESYKMMSRGEKPKAKPPKSMYADDNELGKANIAAFDYHPPHFHEDDTCEFDTIIDHTDVNRTWLLKTDKPVLIRGGAEGWGGMTKWKKESMLEHYGDSFYHIENSGNEPLGKLLKISGRYNMGHMVWPTDDCYAERYRPYSPFLRTTAADYEVPSYLHPMRTFQMGIGTGEGIGVPPEQHPGAWFAAVVGRKRWILTPPGPQPPTAMMNKPGCYAAMKATASRTCDQKPGDIMWVPDFWWHETCGLDDYSVGIGGITYEGADRAESSGRPCGKGEYRMQDVQYCKEHDCPAMVDATIPPVKASY